MHLTKYIVGVPISIPELATMKILPPLNFQPLLFSKQWRLVDRRCTLELLVAKKIMYRVPYSSEAV
jgi:hypothetical protein